MQRIRQFFVGIRQFFAQRIGPFYRAWVATLAALVFGLAPILCSWISLSTRGQFRAHYASALSHGDALMIATALVGPAMILAYKKRDPDTMIAPQLLALIGLALIFTSVVVYMNASVASTIGGGDSLNLSTVLTYTYVLLSSSVVYALTVAYLDERYISLRDLQRIADPNGTGLQVKFPGGN